MVNLLQILDLQVLIIELEGGDFGRDTLVVSLVEILELKLIRERFPPALLAWYALVQNTSY